MSSSTENGTLRGRLKRLLRDDRGTVAVITALTAVPLIMSMGLAVDLTRGYMVRSKLSAALDAAGLAVGTNPSISATQAAAVVQSYLAANFPTTNTTSVTASAMSETASTVTLTATAQVKTGFLGLLGFSTLPVSTQSTVSFSKGFEVTMVLDNTGSLSYPLANSAATTSAENIIALKSAAGKFVVTLFGNTTTNNTHLRVGIVPYVAAVNPGVTIATSMIDPAKVPVIVPSDPSTWWTGCVVERASTFASVTATDIATDLDTPITAAAKNYLTQYKWPSNWFSGSSLNWTPGGTVNSGPYKDGYTAVGPNQSCPTPIVPMTNNSAPLLTAIGADSTGTAIINSGMEQWQNGGTTGSIGMAWGYRMLSPKGPFAAAGQPTADWPDLTWQKVVVLMTDGVNEIHQNNSKNDYTGDPSTTPSATQVPSASTIDAEEEAVCDALKSNGVIIYSVFLNSGSTPGPAISYCAGTVAKKGDPTYYYNASNQTALYAAFASIANDLTNLRISK